MDVIDLDKLASEIARKHLLENISFKELGQMYYTSPSTIHRRLTKWLADGRFELQDKLGTKKAAFAISRDDSLGEALVRKTGIWRARVVRISGVEEAYSEHYLEKPDSQNAQAAYRASDELHRCLGEVAAELMLNSLRRNMTIGISSGRGVGFTIEGLKEVVDKTPSWASGYESIRLVSLCGGAHIGTWEYADSRDFDADENVFSLSSLLKIPRQNVSYMSGPISMDSKSHQPEINPKFSLDMAVIGLGQLNTQHHYLRDYNDLQLKEMSEPIRRIIEWQTRNPELRDSVAEIVLRLYPAANRSLPLEFLETIRETNNSVLAITPEKIKNAGEVILIAGGRQTVNALRGLLLREYPDAPVERRNLTLVTDSWTAETILDTGLRRY
jgi:DNA-binding transcriptional regulator LsrR (DeoR family)